MRCPAESMQTRRAPSPSRKPPSTPRRRATQPALSSTGTWTAVSPGSKFHQLVGRAGQTDGRLICERRRNTVNRRELLTAIAAHSGTDPKVVDGVLRGFTDVVTATVAKGDPVVLTGFAKFAKIQTK